MKLDQKKWMAYAAAGTAAAFTTATAETDAFADVHYSGVINTVVAGTNPGYFNPVGLYTTGGSLVAIGRHGFFSVIGGAGAGQFGALGQVAGFSVSSFLYASKLAYGANISTLSFNAPNIYNTLGWNNGFGNSQWLQPGQGYLAFAFDVGNGVQYAWARLDMAGAPNNSYTIIDWAYADAGESLFTGQTSSGIPEPSTLGALALGAVGMLSWRRSRRKEGQTAA